MCAQRRRFNECELLSWIQLSRCRREDHVDAAALAYFQIRVPRSWIAREIFAAIELQRVYENARNELIVFAPRRCKERRVPLMKCSHSRHKSDRLICPPRFLRPLEHGLRTDKNFRHGSSGVQGPRET